MPFARPTRGQTRRRSVVGLMATALCAATLSTVPIVAAPAVALAADPPAPALTPIDPQIIEQPWDASWSELTPNPVENWANPALVPSIEKWKVALVLTDFRDTPFEVTQPAGSTIWNMGAGANPQVSSGVHDVPRADVPAFYRDLLNTPSAINHGQTLNGYWMENTHGQYGIELDAYGPYALNRTQSEYFIGDQTSTRPPGATSRPTWSARRPT